MNYQNIAEIYDSNDAIRENLKQMLGKLTDEQCLAVPDGEKWSLAQIVEHVAAVEEGMTKICARLLRKAQADARKSDGAVKLSESFAAKAGEIGKLKLEAPEMVKPTGEKTVAESLAQLDANREKLNELRSQFETIDAAEHKFPHPYFGDLSAHEWLVLIGGHEARHLRQIKNRVEQIN